MPCKGDRKKFPLLFGKTLPYPWRGTERKIKKFLKISAYSDLRGVAGNKKKFS